MDNDIAYVSFESKKAAIYIQTLASGERQKISELPGINGAPAWSPDGSQLAMTLSKDGNPEIYVMDLGNRSLRRLTDHFAIDTEPAWSRDGRQIVFTSDRGGKPQLYMVPSGGGQPERITYEGDYNARGVFSPDGKSLAMVHGMGGSYRIALMDLASKTIACADPRQLGRIARFRPERQHDPLRLAQRWRGAIICRLHRRQSAAKFAHRRWRSPRTGLVTLEDG